MDMLNYAHQAHMQDASINCSDNDSTTASQTKGTKRKYKDLTKAEKKQRRSLRQNKHCMQNKVSRNNLEKLTEFFCPFCKLDTDKSEELLEHIKRSHYIMRGCGESLGCPECKYMKGTRKAKNYMTHCLSCNPEMFTEAYIPPENSSIVKKLRNHERTNITTNMKHSESPGCSSMEQEEDDGNQDHQNSGKSDLSEKKRKKINIINILEDSSMKIKDKRKLLYDDRSISHNYGCPKCNKRCKKFESLQDHYRSKHF